MQKISYILIIPLLIILSLTSCSPGTTTTNPESVSVPSGTSSRPALKGNITISGAFALYPMITLWAEEFKKIHPEVTFDISAGGAGKGMADALSGMVDIGMVSRSVTPEEEAQGAYWVAVTKDAVFPTVNAQNPVINLLLAQGITSSIFIKIFITGEITTWGEVVGRPEVTDAIHVYTRSDACGAADTWAKYLDSSQESLLGIGVFGDPGLLDAVLKDPLGIGFNNLNYAYDMSSGDPVEGIVVLPIDINENGAADADETLLTKADALESVTSGEYPSPPARLENLVTNGKPTGLTQTFIEWILGDGQALLAEAGYIPLTPDQLEESLAKVK